MDGYGHEMFLAPAASGAHLYAALAQDIAGALGTSCAGCCNPFSGGWFGRLSTPGRLAELLHPLVIWRSSSSSMISFRLSEQVFVGNDWSALRTT